MSVSTPGAVLAFESVTKQFSGVTVVDDVSFAVERGSIVALLGANGAGKSTLIKILAGVHPASGGRILHGGRDVTSPGARESIGFIHQNLGLIDWMTVAENMALWYGYERRGGRIDWGAVRARARSALEVVGAGIDPDVRIFDLPRTERSLVAIARALGRDVDVLVLDEPTASLPADDVERLFTVLRGLRARGVSMIYVSHRLDEVFALADRVVVMRNGRLVLDAAVAGLAQAALVEAIVGHRPESIDRPAAPRVGAARLVLEEIVVGDVGPVSLAIAPGTIVGLAGLRGAGHELTGRAIAGQEPVAQGRVLLDGIARTGVGPRAAIGDGIAFVSSNRETEGIAVGLDVRENLFLNPALLGRRVFELRWGGRERREARAAIKRHGVVPPAPDRVIETLSGGNQQKVILARWLDRECRVLVLEDPTMGVDVGAKADIYRLLLETAARGTSVVVVSTDFEEIATVCGRAHVFDRGRVVRELEGDALTVAGLTDAASGHAITAAGTGRPAGGAGTAPGPGIAHGGDPA